MENVTFHFLTLESYQTVLHHFSWFRVGTEDHFGGGDGFGDGGGSHVVGSDVKAGAGRMVSGVSGCSVCFR